MEINLSQTVEDIRRNCEISDAKSAGVFSLCSLLLRLRDLYKCEHGIHPWEEPEPAELLDWIENRELSWERIQSDQFHPIRVGKEEFDPFDVESVNLRLRASGLVYGAGYVVGMKPSFFLGELVDSNMFGHLRIDIVQHELVRDIFITPAMRQGDRILARRSGMRSFLWDQILEMRPSAEMALAHGLYQYGIDFHLLRRSPAMFGRIVDKISDEELSIWVYHEIGEANNVVFSGNEWREIVSTYASSPVELYARAIKDLMADTHPAGLIAQIIERNRVSSLAFFIAFMRPFMRVIFTEMQEAFEKFVKHSDWSIIEEARCAGYSKGLSQALSILEIHAESRKRGPSWAEDKILSTHIEPLGIGRYLQQKRGSEEVNENGQQP